MKQRTRVDAPCRGFTLIELLVVLALTAILAGWAWPGWQALNARLRRSEGRAALMQAMQQQERYYTVHNSYAAFSREQPNGFSWHSAVAPSRSAYELQASACEGSTLENCVRIEARPGTAFVNGNAADEVCGMLSLSSRGERDAQGGRMQCWN